MALTDYVVVKRSQASGTLPTTMLDNGPQTAWLDVSPTVQGLGAQALLLLAPLAVWLMRRKPD